MTEASELAPEASIQEGERLHITGLFVSFLSGLPQLVFPIVAAVFGVRQSKNVALIPIVIVAVLARPNQLSLQ